APPATGHGVLSTSRGAPLADSRRVSLAALDLLVGRVAAEGAGGGELAQLVSHHVLRHEDRDELAAVVHGEGVTHELRKDGGAAAPGLDDRLLVGLERLPDLLEEV